MMNGKIDLFFEHGGKYYVLDWKSNYLGDSLEDYAPAALATAMNEHNYHLQYLIYTLAISKYLQACLDGFDYETQFGGVIYLFLRGVRGEGNTGVYTSRPTLQQIKQLESLLRDGAVTPPVRSSPIEERAAVSNRTGEVSQAVVSTAWGNK
jgi:exodeoxyribonuclease V beta subunit